MNKCPEISVILPFYQAERTLDDAIRSIFSQTYDNWELILVNDGSFDNSERIAESWCKIDDRIKLVNQNNQGRSAARNLGIKQANAAWICFLDSDDTMPVDALSILKSKGASSDVVIAAYDKEARLTNRKKNSLTYYSGKELVKLMVDPLCRENDDLIKLPDNISLDSVWAKLYRRELIIENNIEFARDVKFGEDFLFNCFAYTNSKQIQICDEVAYIYNEQLEGTMRQFNVDDVAALNSSVIKANFVLGQLIDQNVISRSNAKYYIGRIVYSAFGRAALYGTNRNVIFKEFKTLVVSPEIKDALREYESRATDGSIYISIVSFLLRHNYFWLASWIRNFSFRMSSLI